MGEIEEGLPHSSEFFDLKTLKINYYALFQSKFIYLFSAIFVKIKLFDITIEYLLIRTLPWKFSVHLLFTSIPSLRPCNHFMSKSNWYLYTSFFHTIRTKEIILKKIGDFSLSLGSSKFTIVL